MTEAMNKQAAAERGEKKCVECNCCTTVECGEGDVLVLFVLSLTGACMFCHICVYACFVTYMRMYIFSHVCVFIFCLMYVTK